MLLKNVFAAFAIAFCAASANDAARAQIKPAAVKSAARSIVVATEPSAMVWLDEVRRGTTDQTGRLEINRVAPGARKLLVRAVGFADKTINLTAAQRGEVAAPLTKIADETEIFLQQAEFAAEGREASKRKAVEMYRRVLQIKPDSVRARTGLARVLNDLNEADAALEEIAAARRINPKSAEASVVEGRIHRKLEDADSAAKAFRRALREAGNRQPEAHTGLALALHDADDLAGAIAEFKIALAQYRDAEPIVYQLLAETYEKLERPKEAVAAYEKFLQLDPKNSLAPGVRSIVEQLKKRGKGDTLELMPQ